MSAARWRHAARRALGEARPSWSSLAAATGATLTLIPFQLEPALALIRGDGCRFLIADAVGLGKTVEAGLMIAETLQRRADASAIVVCPAGLREQWCGELRLRFGLEPVVFDACGLASASARLPATVNPWAVQPLVVTSVDLIKRPEVLRALEPLTWDIVVFDEAHNLTGRSDRAAAAALLGRRARVLVMLTATPHSGDGQAFERLCSLGRLTDGEPLVTFRRTQADAGMARRARALLLRVRPTEAEAAMHAALLALARRIWRASVGPRPGARLVASLLARRGCSSAGSLAQSVARRLASLPASESPFTGQPTLPFDPPDAGDEEPEALLGVPGMADSHDERRRLERLLQLARDAAGAESKVRALRRLLSRTDEPIIVFTEYRDTLRHLAEALSGVETVQLHGGLTARERAEALRQFNDGQARALLATDAGSEGLNLHHRCRLVINLELPWTPRRLEQRAGRVDRLAQTRRVHIVHLVARGTSEEQVLARLVSRIGRLQGAMSLLTRLPDEPRIAASVLGGHPLPDPCGSDAALPEDVVAIDIRRIAQEEAARIQAARGLRSPVGRGDTAERPVIAHVRRRRSRAAAPQCLWAFRVQYASLRGHLVWDALIPLRALPARDRPASARALLDGGHPALVAALAQAREQHLGHLQEALRAPLRRWRAREHGIITALRADDARLAAGLVQSTLFDRAGERLAAAQAQQTGQALQRSGDRLADLDAAALIRVDACELVFALVLE